MARSGKITRILLKKDLLFALYSLGYYGVLFVSFFASSFILKSFLDGIREEDILVTAFPLNTYLSIIIIIISLYLVLVSAISISREKEQGTLETLSYGPVTPRSFLLAKFFKDFFIGIISLGFTAIYFYLVSSLTNIGFTPGLIKALVMGVFLVSCVVSFGLFISSFTGRVRSSIISLIAILGAFLVIQFTYNSLLGIEKEALSVPLFYIRQTLHYVFQGINWISPFAFISRGLDSVVLENWPLFFTNIVYCIVYSVIFIALSIGIMNRKGVKA
ncbi:MAG: ABC transporter permease subunit [Atribacterota bacterium]|nr:ABC transporter permease subunit [Candidatus Atribacteria bacterium]